MSEWVGVLQEEGEEGGRRGKIGGERPGVTAPLVHSGSFISHS